MSWVASVSTLEVTYLFDINCCGQMTVVHKTAPPTGDETNITSDKQSAGNSHTDGLVSVSFLSEHMIVVFLIPQIPSYNKSTQTLCVSIKLMICRPYITFAQKMHQVYTP